MKTHIIELQWINQSLNQGCRGNRIVDINLSLPAFGNQHHGRHDYRPKNRRSNVHNQDIKTQSQDCHDHFRFKGQSHKTENHPEDQGHVSDMQSRDSQDVNHSTVNKCLLRLFTNFAANSDQERLQNRTGFTRD